MLSQYSTMESARKAQPGCKISVHIHTQIVGVFCSFAKEHLASSVFWVGYSFLLSYLN